MILDKISQYIKYRVWAAQQYPDPDYLYRRGGIGDVVRYLHMCASGTVTRDILAHFGADIHPQAQPIGPWITIHEAGAHGNFSGLSVGRNAYIGPEVFLDLSDRIVIEESVTIAMRTIIITHINLGKGYSNNPIAQVFRASRAPTVFKRGCSIGAGAIILSGVTIGEDSVVSAGVVVKKDVPPRTVVRSSAYLDDYVIPERFLKTKLDNVDDS